MSPLHDKQLAQKMNAAMVHRGPDSDGYYEDDNTILAVRRLRIIDLYTGDQPIHNEDSNLWAVLNGEVYNYRELRQELGRQGHQFYTESDTEMVLHAYETWGLNALAKLRGMFAFALWDSSAKRLVLVRDRLGKKPLYYTILERNILFASELRPLLLYQGVPRELNKRVLANYLAYLYNPLDESFISGVNKLPPGHYLIWDAKARIATLHRYWDLPTNGLESPQEADALNELDSVLREAIRIRLRSDVPLGVLLSGGVDSSVVTAIASEIQKGLKTFTVVYPFSRGEADLAKEVAELFGTDHHEYDVDIDFHATIEQVASYLDEPFGDSSIIPTYAISKEARKHVTVCLTGDGGDELFWGYPWLQDSGPLESWFRLPKTIRIPARTLLSWLPGGTGARFEDLARYEDLGYDKLDGRSRCVARLSHFEPVEISRAVGSDFGVTQSYLKVMEAIPDLDKARAYLGFREVLADDYLYKADRASMANSLELRSPFLDQELVEATWRWPTGLKVRNGETKYILKRYAVERLKIPKHVVYREKVGLGLPYEHWFADARTELETAQKTLAPLVGRELVGKSLRTRRTYESFSRIVALLFLSAWAQTVL